MEPQKCFYLYFTQSTRHIFESLPLNGVVVVVAVVAVVVGVVYSSPIIFIVNKNYVQSSELNFQAYTLFF